MGAVISSGVLSCRTVRDFFAPRIDRTRAVLRALVNETGDPLEGIAELVAPT